MKPIVITKRALIQALRYYGFPLQEYFDNYDIFVANGCIGQDAAQVTDETPLKIVEIENNELD